MLHPNILQHFIPKLQYNNNNNIVFSWKVLDLASLMLGNEAWLTVDIPIHPKRVGWSQGSVQASQVFPHQTGKAISL